MRKKYSFSSKVENWHDTKKFYVIESLWQCQDKFTLFWVQVQ